MALVAIVKNESNEDKLAWKYPNDQLNTLTQLIVNESEEAVLFKDGKALDVFEAGRYTLDTPNIPILNKIINIPFGGKSPFKAQVWFVNKIYTLDIKWGTRTPIQIQDPKYSILIPVRAFGQFGIRVNDSKRFLVKLVGKIDEFDIENIRDYFRGLYLTKVKDSISSYLVKKQISITEINAYIDELSEYIKDRMEPIFEEYGIKLASFFVNDISVPEDDPAIKKLKDALAKRAEMDIVGYNYQQERSFNTMDNFSKNSMNQNGAINIGMGLAVGATVGKAVGGEMNKIIKNFNIDGESINGSYCPNCGAKISENAKFCIECGKELFNKCSECGTVIIGDCKYCPNCGKKIK